MARLSFRYLRAVLVSIVVAGGSTLLASPAQATQAADDPIFLRSEASLVADCLEDGYVPLNLVLSAQNLASGFDYSLYCSDGVSQGLLHIDDGHPVDNASAFARCLDRVISLGSYEPTANDSYTWTWTTPSDVVAVVITDAAESGHIRTAFTKGTPSNLWSACGY